MLEQIYYVFMHRCCCMKGNFIRLTEGVTRALMGVWWGGSECSYISARRISFEIRCFYVHFERN